MRKMLIYVEIKYSRAPLLVTPGGFFFGRVFSSYQRTQTEFKDVFATERWRKTTAARSLVATRRRDLGQSLNEGFPTVEDV